MTGSPTARRATDTWPTRPIHLFFFILALLIAGACGSNTPATGQDADTGDGSPGSSDGTSSSPDGAAAGDGAMADSGEVSDATLDPDSTQSANQHPCAAPPPEGAQLAPDPPTYADGDCPELKAGRNHLRSDGHTREFILYLPSAPQPAERFPVLFAWHWLSASADDVEARVDLQAAVDAGRFIAVVPESKGDDLDSLLTTGMPWPFLRTVPSRRMDEEFHFFDDMLACVSERFAVNKECVASMGVSAGALFTAQLAAERSQYLSSFISISGGVGGGSVFPIGGLGNAALRDWAGASRKLPAFVLWGGSKDQCVLVDFDESSKQLEDDLADDGHFIVECEHNCRHAMWTDDPTAGDFQPLWSFFLDHPYWLKAGTSPYQDAKTLPASYPDWCGIGAGAAIRRQGTCPDPSCDI